MSTISVNTEVIAQAVVVHNRNTIMHFLKPLLAHISPQALYLPRKVNTMKSTITSQYFNYIMTVYLIQINLDIMISNCFW